MAISGEGRLAPTTRVGKVSRRRRGVVVVLVAIWILGLLAGSVVGLVFDPYRLPSRNMSPTLVPGDRVLARSTSGGEVSRGDVVIFRAPAGLGTPESEYVSRVVAVAGDEIGEERGRLTINGQPANEAYLPAGTTTPGVTGLKVPDDHVFVMGDNRSNSLDSRRFGPLPNENVRRIVSLRWWPLDGIGGF